MMYDIIVFENFRFRPSTQIGQFGVFKNLHSRDRFQKPAFLVPENAASGKLKRRNTLRLGKFPDT